MANLEELRTIFRDIIGDQTIELTIEDSTETIKAWDSLVSINIMTALSQEYDLTLGIDDFEKFNRVKDIVQVLENNKT